jgi:hypothetical protein
MASFCIINQTWNILEGFQVPTTLNNRLLLVSTTLLLSSVPLFFLKKKLLLSSEYIHDQGSTLKDTTKQIAKIISRKMLNNS